MRPIETGRVGGLEGKWVLVVKDRVVLSSDDAKQVFIEAMKYPEAETVVTKILSPGASFY